MGRAGKYHGAKQYKRFLISTKNEILWKSSLISIWKIFYHSIWKIKKIPHTPSFRWVVGGAMCEVTVGGGLEIFKFFLKDTPLFIVVPFGWKLSYE